MATTKKITEYTALATTPASGDLLEIVDVSDTSGAPTGTNKKIAYSDLVSASGLADDSVTNAKLANMPTQTIKGRTTAGTGDPEDLTATQATAILNAVVGDSGAGGTKGLVPAPGAGDAAAGKFLKADGNFAVPAGTGIGGSTGAADNALLRADGTGGATVQASPITVDDVGAITVPEMAAPATPAAGKVALYAKADGLLYSKDDAGLETVVTGGGGGGTPGGSTTQIQFNDGGAFGGDAGLVWDKTNDIMTLSASGKVRTGTGLAGTPSVSFASFTNYGFFHDGGNAIIAAAGGAEIIGFNTASVSVKTGKSLGFASALGATGLSAGFRNPATGQIAVVNQDSDTLACTIYNPTRTMAAPAGVPTPNLREGNVQRHTMTGNITVGAPSNMVDGIIFTLIFVQDATGSRTAAWNAAYKWAGGSTPVLSTGANAVDIFTFWTNGTNAYEISRSLNVS